MSLDKFPGHDGNPPIHGPVRDLQGSTARDAGPSLQNDNTDRITYLHARKIIKRDQFAAAERFQKDWQDSQTIPVSGMSQIGGTKCRSDWTPADRAIAASQARRKAEAMLGPQGTQMITDVACTGFSVDAAGRRLGFKNAQQAMGAFQACLWALVNHYGLVVQGGRSNIKAWRA